MFNDRKRVDPGTFSFLQTGWWAFHLAAITGIYLLGRRNKNCKRDY